MNRIREERQRKKLTLKETVAELKKRGLISITSDTLSKYERGDREPKLATWQKLADFFEVPVTYLQGISNNKKNFADMDSFSDWTDLLTESKTDKETAILSNKEFNALMKESTIYDFSTLYKAVMGRVGSEERDEIDKLRNQITEEAALSDITTITQETFKLGIKAKSGDDEAKQVFKQMEKLLSKYLKWDYFDDETIRIEKFPNSKH